jgi:hypothetical protein
MAVCTITPTLNSKKLPHMIISIVVGIIRFSSTFLSSQEKSQKIVCALKTYLGAYIGPNVA